MNIDVLWISRHDHIIPRGYADQAMLEGILDRSTWRPADPVTFIHHELRGMDFPEGIPGALVVLPARHHASPTDAAWLKAQLARLNWSILMLMGDEEHVFSWANFPESPTQRVWAMEPLHTQSHLSGFLPDGWHPGTPAAMAARRHLADRRSLDWFFAGQITHARRYDLVKALADLPGGYLYQTDGYMRGMPQHEYFDLLADAKVIPCPSGPMCVDTARPAEALEAGCLPVLDLVKPRDPQFDYWQIVWPGHPLPAITDWATFPALLGELLADWPANANRAFAWWQGYKRAQVHQLEDQIRDLSATISTSPATPDDLITVLVVTSPIISHPSTELIEQTIDSIRDQLPDAEIIIAIDGVRDEQSHRTDDYNEYVRRLLWLTNNHWHNVLPLLMDEWSHQSGMTRRALTMIRTPLLLFVEHDTPLVGSIDWPGLCHIALSGQANHIRLHTEASILAPHEHMMLDHSTQHVDAPTGPVPLRRTFQYWQRPHLSPTRFYRERVLPMLAPHARTMIEDVLYGIVANQYSEHGESTWWDWRIWVYTPDGDMKRSGHTDGRGGETKYTMHIYYEGDIPNGAPAPGIR